jgi:hypothetical protein
MILGNVELEHPKLNVQAGERDVKHSRCIYQVKVRIFNVQRESQDFWFCYSFEEGTAWQSVVFLVLTERKCPKSSGTYRHPFCWNSIAADTYKHIECVMLRNKGRTPDVSDERNPLGPCMDGAGQSLPIVLLSASGCEKWWDSM